MERRLKYACVGAGGIAEKKHLTEYSKIPGVELAAICDSDPAAAKRLAAKFGIPEVFERYEDMFSRISPDLVSICTPNFTHMPITLAALKKGIHVHCEKPLALNAEEAGSIVNEKNRAGKKVMVGLNNRFSNETLFLRKCVEQGVFGEIYHARCGWRRRNGIPGKGVWFTDKKLSGGGALIDLGVHYLDLVLSFMGFPEVHSVYGAAYAKFGNAANRLRAGYKNKGDGKFDVEDMAVGFLRTKEDTTIDFEFSWASNVEKECRYYELLGTKGGATFYNGELKVHSELGGTSIDITPDFTGAAGQLSEFEHFITCILSDKEPAASPEQAAKLMQVIDAVYSSAEHRKEIVIGKN